MTRGWTALAVVIALGMACGGGEAPSSPAPTPVPTATATAPAATATATATPAATATATATPTATVTATATPAATVTATATPAATATATATPAATVTATATPVPTATATAASTPATLVVFSTLASETLTDEGRHWTRRVYVIDTGTGTYWRAFGLDDTDGWRRILAAKASILVADRESVRRFAPDGRDETTLFESEALWSLRVSPDGSKVAFADADGILVLDVASGERLLRAGRDAELAALAPDAPDAAFSVDHWSAASDRIVVIAREEGVRARGILSLDGDLRVLPGNWRNLSPDLRYAIRSHIGYTRGYGVVSGFDVIALESGRAVGTVTADADTFLIPSPGWWLGPDRFSWFEMSRRIGVRPCAYDLTSRPREPGSVTATFSCAGPVDIARSAIASWEEGFRGESAVVGPRVLDVASGTIRKPARDEWRRMRADAVRLSTRGFCGSRGGWAACSLWYEGRPLWTGPALDAAGIIELDEPFTPRGVEVRALPRPSAPQSPPARGEMAGPLLAWSEIGGHEAETGEDGAERVHALRRVMVHDAGAGRSWRAFDYRYPPPDYVVEIHPVYAEGRPTMQVQMSRAGFTVWVEDGWNAGTVRFISLEGRETTLIEHRAIGSVLFSPSGERAVVRVAPDGMDGALLIFDLPSGRLSQRVPLSDLRPWFPDEWWSEDVVRFWPARLEPTRWSTDETAFTIVGLHEYWPGGLFVRDSRAGVLSLDGSFRLLPPDVDEQALSPDFRYIARGQNAAGEYWGGSWESFVIVDAMTGRVVRSVPARERSVPVREETGMKLFDDDWSWTADGRFAWSLGYRSYATAPFWTSWKPPIRPRPPNEEPQPVELLDVRTGEIERLAPDEYFMDERASAGCPAGDPVGRCAVLLDGEVVGRGQWAQVIGVVALD